jgi:hypothetical protein
MSGALLPREERYHKAYVEHLRRREWWEACRLLDETMEIRAEGLQMRFMLEYGAQMSDEEYWQILWYAYKRAYSGLDRITTDQLRSLFLSRPGIELLMSADERRILGDLDHETTLFRGYHNVARLYRFSWTSAEQNAARFALLWHDLDGGGEPMIARATVKKAGIFAVWNDEAEALVDPDYVHVQDRYPVPERYWPMFGYGDRFRERFGRDANRG